MNKVASTNPAWEKAWLMFIILIQINRRGHIQENKYKLMNYSGRNFGSHNFSPQSPFRPRLFFYAKDLFLLTKFSQKCIYSKPTAQLFWGSPIEHIFGDISGPNQWITHLWINKNKPCLLMFSWCTKVNKKKFDRFLKIKYFLEFLSFGVGRYVWMSKRSER